MSLRDRIDARRPQPKPEPRKPEWLRRGTCKDTTGVAA